MGSGSMQSSSGGDEEYDSRGEFITFLNNNPNSLALFGSISSHHNNNPPPPTFLSHNHQQPNSFFDPHSQNLDTAANLFPQTANSQFNTNDLIYSRALRSDHNFNNFAASSSAPLSSSSNVATQRIHHNQNPFSDSSSLPMQQCSIEAANVVRASNAAQPNHQPNVVKNPKKRTRASRRAPTTVLPTDTTNFRQMVQEFTGIPTAPFTGSPYTRRLDLFSTAGSTIRLGHLDSLGPLYPLRPSAQKVQVSPFMPQLSSSAAASSSSLLSSIMTDGLDPTNSTGNNNNSIVGNTTSTSTNFQFDSDHLGIQKQAQNLFNMQNQIHSFNAVAPVPHTKSLDELGISHEQQVSANLISGFQGGNNNISSQARNDGNNLSRLWRNNHDRGQENQRLRSLDANSNNNS